MARYNATIRTGAGSATLPMAALMAVVGSGAIIRSVAISNTTDTGFAVQLVRLTSAGTPGAIITPFKQDPDSRDAAAIVRGTFTGTGPTITDGGWGTVVAAAGGAGASFTIGDTGIRVPKGASNGVAIIPETGVGQVSLVYIEWDE